MAYEPRMRIHLAILGAVITAPLTALVTALARGFDVWVEMKDAAEYFLAAVFDPVRLLFQPSADFHIRLERAARDVHREEARSSAFKAFIERAHNHFSFVGSGFHNNPHASLAV